MAVRRRQMVYEATMGAVAVASVALVFAVDHGSLGPLQRPQLLVLDTILILVSLGDWLVGLAKKDDRRHYFITTAAELPGLIPLALGYGGPLRLLRLLRLIRVARAIRQAQRAMGEHSVPRWLLQVNGLAWAGAGVILVGAALVWNVEKGVNPGFATFGDALWWSIVTVTTVGYGDVIPITDTGRALSVALMASGIGLFAVLMSVISIGIVRQEEAEIEEAAWATSAPHSIAGQLGALAALHDQGKLDDEEYHEAKTKILQSR